jgi:hypothetical protein
MKVGDKVRILETGRVGWIIGESGTSWKIDFINGDKPESVKKSTPMEVVPLKPGDDTKPNPRPKKRMNWKGWAWTIGVILFIAAAIVITLKNVL